MYDIIIIGAGPSGLALAHACSALNIKILIIDSNDSIGGCHRVTRVNGYFTEHGPRIYTSAYKNFTTLLNEMNVKFNDLFVPYNFQITTIGNKTIFSTLSFSELLTLFYDFIKLMTNDDYGKNITMKNHTKHFKLESIDIIDKICRLTDGADISKYTLNEFLQLANQQLLYTIYEPNLPTDEGLFKVWRQFLEKGGVEFMLDSKVEKIGGVNNIAEYIVINGKNIKGKTIVIATPPEQIINILEKSPINYANAFGDLNKLKEYSNKTKYIEYVQVSFHWKDKLKLNKIYGFSSSNWSVAFIVLSDYMDTRCEPSKTIISAAITNTEAKSEFLNKTTNECNQNEIINEIFRILELSFGKLPEPTIAIFNPRNKFIDNKWISLDSAFVSSAFSLNSAEQFDFSSKTIKNLWNVGTHNDRHLYRFTTLESAVTNALILSHQLYPELKYKYKIKNIITIKFLLQLSIIVFVCVILIKFIM